MLSRSRGPILGLLLIVHAGCGARLTAPPPPPAGDARQALAVALDAWKGGKKPGLIDGAQPPVRVEDSEWQGGRKLAGYEILSDEQGQGTRTFTVRLDHPRPPAKAEVRYLVMGAKPFLVFREEDFRRNSSMEDAPRPR